MDTKSILLIVVCTFICLIVLERVWYEYVSPSRRGVFRRKYAHTDQVLCTLREGETIVGVRQESGRLCFYVSNQCKDEKEYE